MTLTLPESSQSRPGQSSSLLDDHSSVTTKSINDQSLDSLQFHKKNFSKTMNFRKKMNNNLDELPSGSGSNDDSHDGDEHSSYYCSVTEEDTTFDGTFDDVTCDTNNRDDDDDDDDDKRRRCRDKKFKYYEDDFDLSKEIGNMTAQIRDKLTSEFDRLKSGEGPRIRIEALGQKVQKNLTHALTVAKTSTEKCRQGHFSDDADGEEATVNKRRASIMEEIHDDDKENVSDRKVRSILKQPHVRRFSRSPRVQQAIMRSTTNNAAPGENGTSMFQADWSQCTVESDEEKTARELREARQEIEVLRHKLKESETEKQNVLSQLEFAKLALENLNKVGSGVFREKGNGKESICQTLDIDDDVVRATRTNQLRRKIFQRR